MLCLPALLLPGKAGTIARRIAICVFAVVLVYMVTWGFVLKSISFEVTKQRVLGDELFLAFNLKNSSLIGATLVDFDLLNEEGVAVAKRLRKIPVRVAGLSTSPVQGRFRLDKFRKVQLKLKTMLIQYTFKCPITES